MWNEQWKEENEIFHERHDLTIERIRMIGTEQTAAEQFRPYFRHVAEFLLFVEEVRAMVEDGSWEKLSFDEMKEINHKLYADISEENYGTSYANPAWAVEKLGEDFGTFLSFLYTEMRAQIGYAYEGKLKYNTICNELFIEIYNCFEDAQCPEFRELKEIVYWYASDYCDVFLADRIEEQISPDCGVFVPMLAKTDVSDERFIFRTGEWITDYEIQTMRHLNSLPEETIQKMADTYTEGFRRGFILGGKDLSKKKTVNVLYSAGFERMIQYAICNFEKMGLRPLIFRAANSVVTKKNHQKSGYYGAVNKQFEYDHRADQALFLDKKYTERKLDVIKNTYEKQKELAACYAGPAWIDPFGEPPFSPERKSEVFSYTDKQEELLQAFASKSSQMINQYIKGEERSFTIISYPKPEIGEDYEAIFNDTIEINAVDSEVYGQIQQTMIDALDQGEYVHIIGRGKNQTDIKVRLHALNDPEKETIFENCGSDVNIPAGEVFTSPTLEGTNGTLFVSEVYLHGMQYKDLKIEFQDGMITDYTCANFEKEEENKTYIRENILHNHETLPLGEFAIGTNTTAYVMVNKYQIADKMTILIAEKMGPHFAVGDTCYSWNEENRVYNPNGKEIIAKDNTISILRKEDVNKAYFQCHTDITIPYEELAEISVIRKDGSKIELLKDMRFVLPGTESLNEPLDRMDAENA